MVLFQAEMVLILPIKLITHLSQIQGIRYFRHIVQYQIIYLVNICPYLLVASAGESCAEGWVMWEEGNPP